MNGLPSPELDLYTYTQVIFNTMKKNAVLNNVAQTIGYPHLQKKSHKLMFIKTTQAGLQLSMYNLEL